MPNFKCLYYFASDEISLLEIKRTDLSENAPPSDIYKWLVISPALKSVFELKFKSMDKNQYEEFRTFVEGDLRFNASEGHLDLNGMKYQLGRESLGQVSSEILNLVGKYLATGLYSEEFMSTQTKT